MAKRILTVLGLIMPLVVSYIIVAALESLDAVYPIGTTTFVSVDFSRSKAQKTDIVAALDALPYRKGEFGALSKTKMTSAADSSSDPAVSGLFVFGDESQAERDLSKHQYGGSRSVTLSSLSDLADASISGAYSFSDADMRNSFEKLVKTYDGAIVNDGRRVSNADVFGLLSDNQSGAFGIVVLCVAICATGWSWAGNRERLHSMLILNGVGNGRILYQDIVDFSKICLSWYCLGGIGASAVVLLTHAVNSVAEYCKAYLSVAAGLALLFVVVIALFSSLTMPSIRQLAARHTLSRRLLCGQLAWKFICAVLALVAGGTSSYAFMAASQQLDSARRWQHLDAVVSVETLADPANSSAEVGRVFQRFLDGEDTAGNMYLSYSVAPALVYGSNGNAPTKRETLQQIAPYDDVVIVNTSFLKLMHISRNSLKKTASARIPSILAKSLKDYDGIWVNKQSPIKMEDCLYEWKGDETFPSLEYNAQSGMFSSSRNPLIILTDDASAMFSLNSFLYPAMSSTNIQFASADSVNETARESAMAPYITSVSRVADDAMYQYRLDIQQRNLNLCFVVIILSETFFCMMQDAVLWIYEKRRMLFIRHTSGASYSRIVLSYFISQLGLLLAALLAAWWCVGQQQLLSGNTSLLMLLLCLACAVVEFASLLSAARRCFAEVVQRTA